MQEMFNETHHFYSVLKRWVYVPNTIPLMGSVCVLQLINTDAKNCLAEHWAYDSTRRGHFFCHSFFPHYFLLFIYTSMSIVPPHSAVPTSWINVRNSQRHIIMDNISTNLLLDFLISFFIRYKKDLAFTETSWIRFTCFNWICSLPKVHFFLHKKH